MKIKNLFILFFSLLFAVFTAELFLFLTGSKILLTEEVIMPGEPFPEGKLTDIFGDYNAVEENSIICKYFNGRKTVYRKFKYSAFNENGIDSCPSYLRPRQ